MLCAQVPVSVLLLYILKSFSKSLPVKKKIYIFLKRVERHTFINGRTCKTKIIEFLSHSTVYIFCIAESIQYIESEYLVSFCNIFETDGLFHHKSKHILKIKMTNKH